MSEIKVLCIVLAIMLILSASIFFYCKSLKDNYPQETFPIPTYTPTEEATIPEETETVGFVPSPEPTIPEEGETIAPSESAPAETEPTAPVVETTLPSKPTSTPPPVTETLPPEAEEIPIAPEATPPIEYQDAHYIWNYLTQTLGYNNYVAAGIMGNIMVEVGGGTLSIQPTLYSYGNPYYYGICQWNKGDFAEIHGASLEQQVEFLGKTMLRQFKTQTRLNTFLSLQNARDAAKMFNTWYEGGAGSEVRANCAEIAYNYFVNQTA